VSERPIRLVHSQSLADRYFLWLYDQVCGVRDVESPLSLTLICSRMHAMPFLPLVPHDENRVAQGGELRNEFVNSNFVRNPLKAVDLMIPDTTVFEVLISLCKAADFMVGFGPEWWFSLFVRNLSIGRYNDLFSLTRTPWPVDRALRRFNERKYKANGEGGLFPLKLPNEDQRKVELWYQMGAYMTENNMY
jgi:hypothetical protein